jgi:hypothetical protein
VANLECDLAAERGWIPPIMPSNRSFEEWANRAYGFLANANPEYYAFFMEWTPNGMVILTDSGNYNRFDSSALPGGASICYGCSMTVTQVSVEVWFILSVGCLIFLVLLSVDLAFAIFHHILLKRSNHKDMAMAAPASFVKRDAALFLRMG